MVQIELARQIGDKDVGPKGTYPTWSESNELHWGKTHVISSFAGYQILAPMIHETKQENI